MQPPAYPAIYDPANKKLHSLVGAASFVVGRSETADLTVLDVTCSRQHFRVVRAEGKHYVEPLSQTSPTTLNGRPINHRTPLSHEDRLGAGNCQFIYLARPPGRSQAARPAPGDGMEAAPPPVRQSTPPPPPPPPPAPAGHDSGPVPMQTLMVGRGGPVLPPPPEALKPIPLVSGKMLIGRDANRVQIPLMHPQISRVHAHITLHNGQAVLVDLNSANGTFVNGARIRKPTTVRTGDQIDIGPYALTFTGHSLEPRTRSDNVELVARNVSRVVTNRETGKPLTLLDDISLVIRPHEFVCLLGPSGSGKSTLLSILSGRTAPNDGVVLVNGQDLHAHFDALKQDIAVTPQKDILHDSLTVGDALWYTARLRLPPDLSRAEVHDCITETLETVSLQQRRGTLIRHLSGGQIKRASLANEIMCKPSLLFLDEVTSGLDEQTDRDMMDLFRSVADTGKTVVCITHSLANVERTCHLVVILTAGGRLAFMGKPAEALEYFNIQRLGDVYERLAEQPVEYWQETFKSHKLYHQYLTSRLPKRQTPVAPPNLGASRKFSDHFGLFFRQMVLLTQRYFAIWRGDWMSLLAMLGQAILVAVLLGLLFGKLKESTNPMDPATAEYARKSVNLLFLMAVTSFWFGCNNAAKEIVKERLIYTRERDFNVQVLSYYCSKFVLLVVFSVIQSMLLAGVVKGWCDPPGNFVGQCFLLAALSVAGVALGLAISAFAPTEEMAITLIPVAVIPQIILSGVIAPLKDVSRFLAQGMITAYWGNRGLDALLKEDLLKMAGLEKGHLFGAITVVFVHAFVFVLAALVVLFWQGRKARILAHLMRLAKAAR
jgi:ABC-type multidrug transport system ATPase subunit/ABC-type multidrug transport system permease subunit